MLAHPLPVLAAGAEASPARGLRQKQMIRTERLDIRRPAGLTYAGNSDLFIVLPGPIAGADASAGASAALMDRFHHPMGSIRLPAPLANVRALAYDRHGERLLLLEVASRSLHAIPGGADGTFASDRAVRLEAPRVGPLRPVGMTVDPQSGEVFVLDRLMRRILRFTPAPAAAGPEAAAAIPDVQWIDLGPLASVELSGLAFDPASGHLFTLDAGRRVLHELGVDGGQVASYDVSAIRFSDPQSMVFAPSGDQTDDPAMLSLFVADPGAPASRRGHVIELAWTTAASGVSREAGILAATAATLVRVTPTSAFSPPSPDPSGVGYDPVSGRLIISDAEVEEMPIYAGKNIFETSLTGTLLRSWTTLPWDVEPTGTAPNGNNRHLFVSNDDADRVWDVNPGPDNLLGTSDDTRTSFKTNDFGCGDPEGIAYDRTGNRLFIADGVNEEIYVVLPGPNGVFNGVSPVGDDQVTHFDTGVLGSVDPETVEWKSDTGTLLVLGSTGSKIVREVTTTGTLIANTDISFAPLNKPAGLAYAPSSGGGGWSYYIVNRAVDNNSDPKENDGTLVEISVGGTAPGNVAPSANAGPDQTITLPAQASLDGTVSDDGLPSPPTLTTTWSFVSGPGTVTFANPNAVDTQASFSIEGTYVLRLTGSDGALSTNDQAQITVLPVGSATEIRVAAGTDDAEESPTGVVTTNSSDLELVFDAGLQTVGVRFTNVAIPQGATISNAYIQFQADEVQSEVTSLLLQGQAADNAATFATGAGNVSTRPRTAASVSWAPPAWSTVDEAGPNQRTPELKTLIQEIVNRPGWASGNALAIVLTGTGHRTARAFEALPAAAALLHIAIAGGGGTNTAPTANAGSDQTITLPAQATLDGTVGDDGLPSPPSLTTTWSVVSGPGTVTFANANAVDTQASFTINGTYVLRLAANDGELITADEVQITVQPGAGNAAPTVNAGTDQTITLPAQAALDGTVTDDLLPSPPTLTTTWSLVSGPGTVTFQNANAVDTQASFSTAGTYVLRLTASDGQLSASDQVQITVQPANAAPTANAGPDLEVTLPAQAVLNGTVSDDGLPSPPSLTTTWSMVSGPGLVTFLDPNAVDTQASFSTSGTYVLRLTASDGSLSTSDQAQITVYPAGTLFKRIATGTDDAEESASGSVAVNGNDLELVFSGSNQRVGLRFSALAIPQGATINSASIQFRSDEAQGEATALLIQGQAVGNALAFVRTTANISARPRTTASVSWAPAPWGAVGLVGPDQRTPDIAAIIQEIVNRPDWVSGNSIVIIITGTGHRTAESFEGLASGAARLELQYQ